jgi:tetratricopeptide (TPR) repeat protein/CHAT domain-containing protein
MRRAFLLIMLTLLLVFAAPMLALAQGTDDLDALNKQFVTLYGQGKYAEAIEVAKRSLALAEKKFGPDHRLVGTALNNLAELHRAQGRFAEAEPLYKRAIAIDEKALGRDHTEVGTDLNNLGELYRAQGRYAETEPLYKRAIAIDEKALGPNHPTVGIFLNNLALLYQTQGRYGEAEPLYKRSLAIREKALGPNHPTVGIFLNNLALLYKSQGRYAEAEPLYKRALTIAEVALGPEHPTVGQSLNNLAELYRAQGRYGEAEPLYKRCLAIFEKALGSDHPDVGTELNNLALLYQTQGRYGEAEPLYKRSLVIREKALGSDHRDIGTSLNNLALLYQSQGRTAEAEQPYKRALAIFEKALGPEHPTVGQSLNNLAELYRAQGRYGEAEPLYTRAVAISEKALGSDHPDVASGLNNLALLYQATGRYVEAERQLKRALAIAEKALGPDHPNVGSTLSNLAELYFVQQDWTRSADYWRRSTSVIIRRAQRGLSDGSAAMTGKGKSEAAQLSYRFFVLVKAGHRVALGGRAPNASIAQEMFETAQWAFASEAAASLAQMAVRGAKGDPRLAAVVRERQDLVAEWEKRDGVRTAAVSQAPNKRDRQSEAANVARLDAVDARITEIDKQLKAEFREYVALVKPASLSVEQVQADLHPDEALVLFLDTPEWKPTSEETFIWVVTKTESRWVRSELGTPSLRREVAALRCGLDDALWNDPDSYDKCAELVKKHRSEANISGQSATILPFDRDRAHTLYKALFSQIEDVIKDKHLLIVPSGALTQFPFQVLITDKPGTDASGEDGFRSASWLVRKHALTVLPSVSSLKALRELAKDSHAPRTMIGFGNPLLDGPGTNYRQLASAARSKQSCPEQVEQRVAAISGDRRGVLPLELRRGLADVAQIRIQVPLPETADELCAVARDLRVSGDEIRLGARATEAEIKRLSEAGELSKYRIIHFATHGALAGQVSGNSEPGLLLTPPDTASEGDDGYLSASEIAALKLNTDWVILSACNTAAGGAEGAEALSGLARAFFYAGGRALLVSHWAVYSDATVKLITGAVGKMAADKSVGRAEAMRQSMLSLIDKGTVAEAHPAFWAPFVVVGEGAAAR